jgi:selenocysteine lyase/cysteine desulfurase
MFRTGLAVPEDMSASMVDVQLPTSNKTTGTAIPTQLLERFGTWIPVYTLADADKPDVIAIRVSCQVYNSIDDVKMAGNAILQIIRELEGDSKLI